MHPWRRTAASGLIVLAPVLICGYLVTAIFWQLAQLPILAEVQPSILRVLVILVVSVLATISTGRLMRTAGGRFIDQRIDATVNRFPGIGILHTSLKNAIESIVAHQDAIKEPIRIEMWDSQYMTAFRTGNWTPDGREVVFVPGSPDITAGFVVEYDVGILGNTHVGSV